MAERWEDHPVNKRIKRHPNRRSGKCLLRWSFFNTPTSDSPEQECLSSLWGTTLLTYPPQSQGCIKCPWNSHCSQRPLLNLVMSFCFAMHPSYRAFGSQSQIFTQVFPSSHLCLSQSLYFEGSFFNCSQANNHSSSTSFSVKPPVTHATVCSLPPTYLCHILKARDDELNTGSPRDGEKNRISSSPFRLLRIGGREWGSQSHFF